MKLSALGESSAKCLARSLYLFFFAHALLGAHLLVDEDDLSADEPTVIIRTEPRPEEEWTSMHSLEQRELTFGA